MHEEIAAIPEPRPYHLNFRIYRLWFLAVHQDEWSTDYPDMHRFLLSSV